MNSLSDSSMTLLLLFVLVIALAITFAILSAKNKRMENFHQYSGRNPNGCFDCCGNIDWFLGKYYKKLCPGSVPPAFQNTSAYNSYYNPMNDPENSHKHFNNLQENFSNKEGYRVIEKEWEVYAGGELGLDSGTLMFESGDNQMDVIIRERVEKVIGRKTKLVRSNEIISLEVCRDDTGMIFGIRIFS